MTKAADIVFSEDTTIIHISGNKDNRGKITKANQGLMKVFGYTKTEIIGHAVNILMPNLFAQHHNDFFENFVKTGRKTVFNTERDFYGLSKNGFCFGLKLLVKQMPSLTEGIQYVGMIRQFQSDCEFILTNSYGIIDSFSSGIASTLNLSVGLFKETNINIQILAPELIKVFNQNEKKNSLNKSKEPGGRRISFFMPKDFLLYAQGENKKSVKSANKAGSKTGLSSSKRSKNPLYWTANSILNNHGKINNKQVTTQELMQSHEYRECEQIRSLKCEICEQVYGDECDDSKVLKLQVFKISNLNAQRFDRSSESIEENSAIINLNAGSFEAKEGNLSQHEEKKDLVSLVLVSPATVENVSAENQEVIREDTKATDKLPGNIVTTDTRVNNTEARIGTFDISSTLKTLIRPTQNVTVMNSRIKPTSSMAPELIKGEFEAYSLLESESFNSAKIPVADDAEQPYLSKGSQQFKILKEIAEEVSTPRIGLENIKGPEKNLQLLKNKTFNELASESDSSISVNPNEVKAPLKNLSNAKYKSSKESSAIKMVRTRNKVRKGSISSMASDDKCIATIMKTNSVFLKNTITDFDTSKEGNEEIKQGFNIQMPDPSTLKSRNKGNARLRSNIDKTSSFGVTRPRSKTPEDYVKAHRRSSKFQKSLKLNIMLHPVDKKVQEMLKAQEYKPTEDELKMRRALVDFDKKNKEKKVIEKKKKVLRDSEKSDENNDMEENNKIENESKDEENSIEKIEEITCQDMQSSGTSKSIGSAMRCYFSLRTAIDEKYTPKSIRNMAYAVQVAFLIVFGITIACFVIQTKIYDKIEGSIVNVNYAENRISNIVSINLRIANIMIFNTNCSQYIDPTENSYLSEKSFNYLKGKLKDEAIALKKAQIDLSIKKALLSAEFLQELNPKVELIYMEVTHSPTKYTYTIWQAIMEIVVGSYKISGMATEDITDETDATVYFVTKNSLNNILAILDVSSDLIMNDIEESRKLSKNLFIIIISIATFVLTVTTLLLIPLLNWIKISKQEILELFMRINKRSANNELNKCRRFLGTFQAVQETELIANEEENSDEDEEQNADLSVDHLEKLKSNEIYGSSKRKSKRLILSIGLTIIKFIFILLVMECYFLLHLFLSFSFLDKMISLTKELDLLVSRFSVDSFLLLCEKLAIFKDYNAIIKNQNVEKLIHIYHNEEYANIEKLLDKYSKNVDYHSSRYNKDFNEIIFSNVCEYLAEFQNPDWDCTSINQGILKKGIYSSIIKYWDYLRELNTLYSISNRTLGDQCKYLNSKELAAYNIMQERYFNISMSTLVHRFKHDIEDFFDWEYRQNQILYIVYLICMILVFIFFWSRFLLTMQRDLWRMKSILSILSPKLIMNITEIKTFILNNSSTAFFTKSQYK